MQVIPLSKALCEKWVLAKHYSHRSSIFWAGFGLEVNNKIEGVCVFGQPSPPIQKHAFTDRDFKLYMTGAGKTPDFNRGDESANE